MLLWMEEAEEAGSKDFFFFDSPLEYFFCFRKNHPFAPFLDQNYIYQ